MAQEAPSPTAQAIVVRADSPLKSLGDLKGKKVGVAKGSEATTCCRAGSTPCRPGSFNPSDKPNVGPLQNAGTSAPLNLVSMKLFTSGEW